MPTFVGSEQASPNLAVDTFAPTGLDIDQWLDACVAAGMQYAALTTKHHDGFALWPTAFAVAGNDPYSIAQTAWYAANGSPDVVDLFVTKCRAKGLNPCLYFSIWDTTYETRSGTDQASGAAAYIAMIEAQLTELLTNYGGITAVWLDGWAWHVGYTYVPYLTIKNFIKGLQPNCLVVENSHAHPTGTSEIEVYETPIDGSVPTNTTRLLEEVDKIRASGGWFYNAALDQTAATLRTSAGILAAVNHANANNGTYLLAITPGTNGVLPAAQVTLLNEVGP